MYALCIIEAGRVIAVGEVGVGKGIGLGLCQADCFRLLSIELRLMLEMDGM